jgi:hypothetical protein
MYAAPLATIKVTVGGEYGGRRGHKGVDLRAKAGTPVAAVIGGEYVRSGFSSTHGYFGIWLGDDGNYWNVQHLKVPFGARGRIEVAEVIALTGSTGNVSGPHLHIGVSTRNSLTLGTFDPAPLLTSSAPVPPTESSNTMASLVQNTHAVPQTVICIRDGYPIRTVAANEYTAFLAAYGPLRTTSSTAEFDFIVYEANDARTAFLAQFPGGTGGGGLTTAEHDQLFDIANKGELGQALTSAAQLVNDHTDDKFAGLTLTTP